MDDLIRRKDAIDMLEMYPFVEYDEYAEAREVINRIPSAQPESRCNTCRYTNLEWYEEPCDSCTMGGESNHYKPSAQRTGGVDSRHRHWMPDV